MIFRETGGIGAQCTNLCGGLLYRSCRRQTELFQQVRRIVRDKGQCSEKRHAVICRTTDINEIHMNAQQYINFIVGKRIHKVEGRCLRPKCRNALNILGRKPC